MTLGEKQREFTLMLAGLITWAYAHGMELTLGEAFRSDEQAEINALGADGRRALCRLLQPLFPQLAAAIANNTGSGIRGSLHGQRLAVDVNLFLGGVFQTTTEAYRPLGEQWESIGGTWGGRFGDGNHFSLEHMGFK